MNDERGGGRGPSRRPPGGPRFRDDSDSSYDDAGDEGYEDDAPAFEDRDRPDRVRGRAARGGARTPPRKPAQKAKGFSFFGLGGIGGGAKRTAPRGARRDQGFDWGAADDEEGSRDDAYAGDRGHEEEDEYDESPKRRRRGPPPRAKRKERQTLLELCTPVFGYAAILPRESGGVHPGYKQFRQEVLTALQRVESEAKENGIDPEDANEARYALCLFMDEQVAESEWSGKDQWAAEPLNVTFIQDPEGGVNFFAHLDSFGDRQRGVKEVYLVCLALGFRGKYAELDPTQQAARIGEIRQKLLRSIHPVPMDSQDVLFPEAYEPAAPIEDEAPPPPRWWLFASIGTVAVVILVYLILFWRAAHIGEPADETLQKLSAASPSSPTIYQRGQTERRPESGHDSWSGPPAENAVGGAA